MSSSDENKAGSRTRPVLRVDGQYIEVVQGEPGVWHPVRGGRRDPALSAGELPAMIEADEEARAADRERVRSGRPEDRARLAGSVTAASMPVPVREVPFLAEYLAVMAGPAGLGAAELERLVPDCPPGCCTGCRTRLSAREGPLKCTWCMALDSLRREIGAEPPGAVPPVLLRGPARITPARRAQLLPALLLAASALCFLGAVYGPALLMAPCIALLVLGGTLGTRR